MLENWRYILASCPLTPSVVLSYLAKSSNMQVRKLVAAHKNVSTIQLSQLAVDGCPEVRIAMIHNRFADIEMINQMILKAEPELRIALVEDVNCREEVLQILLHDANPYISREAEYALSNRRSLRTGNSTESLMFRLDIASD